MIQIGQYNFEGPYTSTALLENKAGIYAILDDRGISGVFVIDVGESSEVKSRIENHDRKDSWGKGSIGTLKVAVLYTPGIAQPGRICIEQALRNLYNPVCGVR